MSISTLQVTVLGHQTLTTFDDTWHDSDYLALLEACEYEGISEIAPEELEEMCLLALQDLGPLGAARVVLTHRLGDRLRKGQIEAVAVDLGEDKQWEHHADLSLHEPLFHVGALLWRALPDAFPAPDAIRLELGIQPLTPDAARDLRAGVDEALLVRLIADGMSESSLLHRLFADQLERGDFDEATAIIWTFSVAEDPPGVRVEVVGSRAWIGPVRHTGGWTSDASAHG